MGEHTRTIILSDNAILLYSRQQANVENCILPLTIRHESIYFFVYLGLARKRRSLFYGVQIAAFASCPALRCGVAIGSRVRTKSTLTARNIKAKAGPYGGSTWDASQSYMNAAATGK